MSTFDINDIDDRPIKPPAARPPSMVMLFLGGLLVIGAFFGYMIWGPSGTQAAAEYDFADEYITPSPVFAIDE